MILDSFTVCSSRRISPDSLSSVDSINGDCKGDKSQSAKMVFNLSPIVTSASDTRFTEPGGTGKEAGGWIASSRGFVGRRLGCFLPTPKEAGGGFRTE